MPLEIKSIADLKNMVGYHIDNVEIIQPVNGLMLLLSHISEPQVKYQIEVIPDVKFGLNGNILSVNKGIIIKSVGVIQATKEG